MKLLVELADMTEITNVTNEVIRQSFRADFKNYEDAIQYHSALSIPDLDFIVTRNTKDFKKNAARMHRRGAFCFWKIWQLPPQGGMGSRSINQQFFYSVKSELVDLYSYNYRMVLYLNLTHSQALHI